MANYNEVTRTNYFHVTDEERYVELYAGLSSGYYLEDFTEKDKDGRLFHGFGGYESIDYYPPCNCSECSERNCCEKTKEIKKDCRYNSDSDFDEFLEEMQKILPEDEAMIIMASGYEKLRYVSGYAIVVTRKEIKSDSLDNWAVKTAKELVGEGYEPKISY